MDLLKKLTGKNPTEYELVAKSLVDTADTELFAKLVKQDEFLFDFIKNNVAKRIQNACTKENYLNLIKFFDYYSASYDTMIARVLHSFGGDEILPQMQDYYLNGTSSQKAYAVKYFSFVTPQLLEEIVPLLRQSTLSEYEPLAINSIEVLSLLHDEISKNNALKKLESKDEFEQYEAIKFLAAYQAKDSLDKMIQVMKKSSLSENIASEILYMITPDELLEQDFDSAILVLCNIINAIPEILPPSSVMDYGLHSIFEKLPLTTTSAVLLRLAKEKFDELTSNEEYLFDCDKNTKEEIKNIHNLLKNYKNSKLESLLYDELFEESDFVFFALDFVSEKEELETLLDSQNETLILKVLTLLKDRGILIPAHKETALKNITLPDIKSIVELL